MESAFWQYRPEGVTQIGISRTVDGNAHGVSSKICTNTDADCLDVGKQPDLCEKKVRGKIEAKGE